tara:strand:- start:2449 stop:2631 length:183 start_codon:yes stop_codon:yes gene_type:complete
MIVGQLIRQKRTGIVGMIVIIENCKIAQQWLMHILAPAITSKLMIFPLNTQSWEQIQEKQ